MIDIEVVLVYAEYNKNRKINDGQLPIKTLLEVSASDYPVFVKIGQWLDGEKLYIQPHLRAKVNEQYKNVDIAIKVKSDLSKTIDSITTEPSGYRYQKYEDDYIYYLPPRNWKKNKFNKIPQETMVGHYTTIGSETIQITFHDGHKESMTLISKFQDEEKNFYKELIFDLISMQQQLCIDDSSSMSMAIKWSDNLYKETEQIIKEFCDTFWLMEKNAQPELKPFQDKKSFHKIRKFSSRTLIEHEIFHKDKVASISYKEDFDTFEHRVIKTHLKRLKNMVKVRQNMEILALENEKSRLKDSLSFSKKKLEDELENVSDTESEDESYKILKEELKKVLDEQLEDELERKISELHRVLENKRYELKNKLDQNDNTDKSNLQTVYIQFRVSDVLPSDINGCIIACDTKNAKIQIKSITAKDCNYKVKPKNKTWPKDWKEYISDNSAAKTTQYINISADCTNAAAIIFYYLSSRNCIIKENDIVGIWGDVMPDYDKGINSKNFSKFDFVFRNIKGITVFEQINGKPLKEKEKPYKKIISELSTEEKRLIIEEFYNYILNFDLQEKDENIGFYTESLDSQKLLVEINKKLKDEKEWKKKWEILEQNLDEIETSSFMVNVKDIRTSIRTSNLFAFHPSYQKIYAVMTKNNNKMTGIDYYSTSNDDEFRVAKLSNLYEIWCCIKLILIFIQNYGFKFISVKVEHEETGMEGLKKYIQNILNNDEMSGTQFDLRYSNDKLNINISIWYDREISINKEKLQENHIFAKKQKSQLRPDIIMKISVEKIENKRIMSTEEKLFILDAKYRGNEIYYDGIKDLCEVAFQKYTLELGNGMEGIKEFKSPYYLSNENIDGSFIIHSNNKAHSESYTIDDIEIIYNPQNYLGAYPDKLFDKTWADKIRENNWEVLENKFRDWCKWSREIENHENHIGIMVANPKENKLTYFIQMIMEQHFGLYQFKCWICGSDNINSVLKYTEKGYPKYHIKCMNPECKKFTVETHCGMPDCPSHNKKLKLGKHYINYFAQSKKRNKDACWNVSCPKCRQLAPSKITKDVILEDAVYMEEFPFG